MEDLDPIPWPLNKAVVVILEWHMRRRVRRGSPERKDLMLIQPNSSVHVSDGHTRAAERERNWNRSAML
jgi:hypothetical protein